MKINVTYANLSVGVISLLLLLVVAYFVIFKRGEENLDDSVKNLKERLKGPIIDTAAAEMVSIYRGKLFYRKTHIVAHDLDTIIDLMSMYKKYLDTFSRPENYEWLISFTPMFTKVDEKARLSFCVLPALVNTGRDTAYDYFTEREEKSSIYKSYFEPLYRTIREKEGKSFIHDEGHLWP